MSKDVMLIEFEDLGQAFSWWLLDENGVIINTDLVDSVLWNGCKIKDHLLVTEGERVTITGPGSTQKITIKCRVQRIRHSINGNIENYTVNATVGSFNLPGYPVIKEPTYEAQARFWNGVKNS